MRKISALEFLDKGGIKVYFFEENSEILNGSAELGLGVEISEIKKYIKESGERFYYRTRIEKSTEWYDRKLIRVPRLREHQLEIIANQIKNILN